MAKDTRILIVHGDPAVSSRMGSALRKVKVRGFGDSDFVVAGTLAEAVKLLDSWTATLIIAGLDLADSTGVDTLRELRRKCPAAPMIVLVVDDDHHAGAQALGNGAQDYFFASETREDVISRGIIRAIERRRVEEEHADIGWRSGIGETALGVRHEINNPLASLMLNLEMLKEGGHEDGKELLNEIEVAAKRIAAVVRRLEGLKTPQRIPAIGGEAMVDLSGDKGERAGPNRKSAGSDGRDGASSGRTILLVDDEESVRAIVTKILSRHGHNVLEAEHGADALRLAAGYEGPIDLLITDMYMPGLRGPEILEKLRPSRPAVKVLFMSGYGDEDVARSGVEPDSGFLRKPFTVQELSDAVSRSLESDPAG